MDGIIIKKKKWQIIGLVWGLIFGGLFICMGMSLGSKDLGIVIFNAAAGILVAVFSIVSLCIQKKVFIHLDDEGINAFCHYGLSLNCCYDDIKEVSLDPNDHSHMKLRLKNGRRYSVFHIRNYVEIYRFILNRIDDPVRKDISVNNSEEIVNNIRSEKKKESVFLAGAVILIMVFTMIVIRFLNGREVAELDRADKTVFYCITGFAAIIYVCGLVWGNNHRKRMQELQKKSEGFQSIMLKASYVNHNRCIAMFLDDMALPALRVLVFGYPNSESVFCRLETLNGDYKVVKCVESEIFDNYEELEKAYHLNELIKVDISDDKSL